jgi:hypothetical protein
MSEMNTDVLTWDDVLTGQVDLETAAPLFAASAREIEGFLEADSETEEEALDVLRRRLSGPLDAQTYDAILEALRALMGEDGTNLVHWYVANPENRAVLQGQAPVRVDWFLRRIAAEHGLELRAAFSLWRDLAHDWRSISRDVYYDVVRQQHYIRHRITKVNGEELLLEGNADSVLDLARNLLLTLTHWVGTPDVFSPNLIEAFLTEVQAFTTMGQPEPMNGTMAAPETAT